MENEIKVGEFFRTKKGNIFKLDKYWLFNDKYKKIDIVKHSPNLIDILECGDYINGHKIVNEIWGEDDNNLYFEIEGGYNKARYIGENEIKEVVAKEQFESISYKVTKM